MCSSVAVQMPKMLLTLGKICAHRSNFPPYLISHGKLVCTFKYVYTNFPEKGNMCHHNISSGISIFASQASKPLGDDVYILEEIKMSLFE